MRFTFLAAMAACPSMAMRPELGRASAIAKIGKLVSKITTSPTDSLVALQAATGIVNGIFAETGNASDHMSGDDAEVLKSVISLVESTIYSSMDQSNEADMTALAGAVDTAGACNTVIAQRQSPEGDLGALQQQVKDKQTELNRLDGVVGAKRDANNSAWGAFYSHMQMISTPPDCPGFPARNMGALDVYFEKSLYSIWFDARQSAYETERDAFNDADSALEEAINAFNVQKAVRDQEYCDWTLELNAACAAFDTCFSDASDFFSNTLVPQATSDMNGRIEVKKAGDTLVHQIKFLLGEVGNQQTPQIDTSRYEIAFPDLPAKGLCDLSPLGDAMWVPTPSCDAGAPGKP